MAKQTDYVKLFDDAYEVVEGAGNSHCQSSAYAEWRLFAALAEAAPKSSYYAGRQAAHWLRELARLEVKMPTWG